MKPDLVDTSAIADRLGVKLQTVQMWRHRELLPKEDWLFAIGPVWRWSRVEKWARETGRLSEPRSAPDT